MRKSVIVVVLLAFAPPAQAQQLARTVRFSVDNDFFDFWIPTHGRADNDYSQGMRVSWDDSGVPSKGKRLVCGNRSACGLNFEVGQEMYTPDIDSPTPVPGERPYAGWLYGRAAIRTADEGMERSIGLTAGVTGPPSLGERVQVAFHHTFGFRQPMGWKYQLATEPAFALEAEQSWRVAPEAVARFADFVPSVGVTVGTLRTAAKAGGRLRFGFGLDHPWLATRSRNPVTLQVFVGGHVEGVARDLFLDGNTFQNSVHVDGETFRSEWERGVRIGARRLTLEYAVVSQSREYRTGPAAHTYATLAVEWTMKLPDSSRRNGAALQLH